MPEKIFLIITTSLYISFSFAQDNLVIKKNAKSYLRKDQHFHFNIPLYIPSFKGDFSYVNISVKPNVDIKDNEGLPQGGGGNLFEKFF